jgi:integrase
LLDDLAANGHSIQPDLIRREDFPQLPQYLPRPLPPQDDQLLRDELRRTDDLPANALLLTRVTGIRIGECIALALDCLRQVGPDQWALHVPLGKLHTERLVPVDEDGRHIMDVSLLCAPWPHPPDWPNRRAFCCRVWAAITPYIRRCSGP